HATKAPGAACRERVERDLAEHVRAEHEEDRMSEMQPLRDEHQRLWPEVERLRALAERLGERDPQEFDHELTAVRQFLRDHLIPHLRAEEAVLYPAVAAAMGSPAATATMSRDHLEMDRLAQELGKLHQHLDADPAGLQRVLYGLYALLAVHLAKEDEIYLPLLEQVLSAEE